MAITESVSGVAAILEGADVAAAVGTDSVFGVAAILEGADTAAGVGTDSVSGIAAILEGLDVIAGIGTDSVFGIAAVLEGLDTVAGSATDNVQGAAAILEDSEIVVASGTGVSVVTTVAEVPAGRKILRSIYRLTVDGQVFHFRTLAAALAFLDKAKALALAAAQAQTRLATDLKAVSVRPSVPVIRTNVPSLRGAVLESNAAIRDTFDAAWRDVEIALLIRLIERQRNDRDAEDMLWIFASGDDVISIENEGTAQDDDELLWLM
jgi:hypothetical protein